MSSIRHRAGRNPPRVRCTISFESMKLGRKSPNCLLLAINETPRKAESLKEVARMERENDLTKGEGAVRGRRYRACCLRIF